MNLIIHLWTKQMKQHSPSGPHSILSIVQVCCKTIQTESGIQKFVSTLGLISGINADRCYGNKLSSAALYKVFNKYLYRCQFTWLKNTHDSSFRAKAHFISMNWFYSQNIYIYIYIYITILYDYFHCVSYAIELILQYEWFPIHRILRFSAVMRIN